jgi:hypothetical protein
MMEWTYLYQIAIIPAVLVTLVGLLFLRGQKDTEPTPRFLIFYLVVCILMLLTVYLLAPDETAPPTPLSFELPQILIPVVIGSLTIIFLNLKSTIQVTPRLRLPLILLATAIVILLILLRNSRLAVGFYILPGVLILAALWFAGSRSTWLAIGMGILGLCMILLFNWIRIIENQILPRAIQIFFALLFFLTPTFLAIMPSLLTIEGLKKAKLQPRFNKHNALLFIFSLIMLAFLAYAILWGGIWDQTMDMGFGFIAAPIAGYLAIAAAMLMTNTLRGKSRLTGLLYMILVPSLIFQAYEIGRKISHQTLTENRAGKIAAALLEYHDREGRYPEKLGQLVPRDLLFLPRPVILLGENWCYHGNQNQFALAAFYREFWSSPVSLRVYESAGNPPEESLPCQGQLAAMKQKYYSPLDDPQAARPPVPTPLPDINVGIPITEIRPLLEGLPALPGSWSPDSAYFVFAGADAGLNLHFLRADTGDICTADIHFTGMDDLRKQHAWLPDGRLFFIDSSGKIVLLAPCEQGRESLADHFPVTFTEIAAYSPQSGRMLLKSKQAYGVLDTNNFNVQPVPEVSPVPYDFHWDTYAWLPGGENLVIARLNGRKGSTAGSTLFEIDGTTGEVQKEILLSGEYGQSSPWIEGLSKHELLVHDQGRLLILDFNINPPAVTNALKDIFHLDIPYPDKVSAAGSIAHKDGNGYYLAVRLNHPRNQATYLYSSREDRVYEYDHEHHSLLLFPDGEFMDMPKQEDVPAYTDEYDVVLVDQPEAIQPGLKLTGHKPREYPHLSLEYLKSHAMMAVASAHGISLVSLPDGKMNAYWTLVGDGYSPSLLAAPDGSALIAVKDYGSIYFIQLPQKP